MSMTVKKIIDQNWNANSRAKLDNWKPTQISTKNKKENIEFLRTTNMRLEQEPSEGWLWERKRSRQPPWEASKSKLRVSTIGRMEGRRRRDLQIRWRHPYLWIDTVVFTARYMF